MNEIEQTVANIVGLLLRHTPEQFDELHEQHEAALRALAPDDPARGFVAMGAETFAAISAMRRRLETIAGDVKPVTVQLPPAV